MIDVIDLYHWRMREIQKALDGQAVTFAASALVRIQSVVNMSNAEVADAVTEERRLTEPNWKPPGWKPPLIPQFEPLKDPDRCGAGEHYFQKGNCIHCGKSGEEYDAELLEWHRQMRIREGRAPR